MKGMKSVLKQSSISDLVFINEALTVHYELKEKRIGYRPVSIQGIPIPKDYKIVYVEVLGEKDHYFYTVHTLDSDSNPPVRVEKKVSSHQAAQEIVLDALIDFATLEERNESTVSSIKKGERPKNQT